MELLHHQSKFTIECDPSHYGLFPEFLLHPHNKAL